MSFISKMNPLKSAGPSPQRKITMDDIKKCKTGSYTARFIGQIKTAWKTGAFIRDKDVVDFMLAHFKDVDAVHEQFQKLTPSESSNVQFEVKELKANQAERRLTKAFIKASESQSVRYTDLEAKMKVNYEILNGRKALDRCDPKELLRAAVFDGSKGVLITNDLKRQFMAYVKDKNIEDDAGLKEAFSAFKDKVEKDARNGDQKALNRMRSYPKDESFINYALSAKEGLNLDKKGVDRVRAMTVGDLIKADQNAVKQIILEAMAAMSMEDPKALLQSLAHEREEGIAPKNELKTHFNAFLKEFLKNNKVDDEVALKNAFVIFKKELQGAAEKGDLFALRKLQAYPKDRSMDNIQNAQYKDLKDLLPLVEKINVEDVEEKQAEKVIEEARLSEEETEQLISAGKQAISDARSYYFPAMQSTDFKESLIGNEFLRNIEEDQAEELFQNFQKEMIEKASRGDAKALSQLQNFVNEVEEWKQLF